MVIDKEENYTLVSYKNEIISLENIITDFETKHSDIKNDNIFLMLSDKLDSKEEDFFVFLKYAEFHSENGTTFVLICKGINIDKFPENFNIAPTLTEAEDILEMENIQRDLGF